MASLYNDSLFTNTQLNEITLPINLLNGISKISFYNFLNFTFKLMELLWGQL